LINKNCTSECNLYAQFFDVEMVPWQLTYHFYLKN
jgi:hypothetical protein